MPPKAFPQGSVTSGDNSGRLTVMPVWGHVTSTKSPR
jgi:hypothetical protein